MCLTGRITAEPELRAIPSGKSTCTLRLAFNTPRKNQSGAWEDKRNFVNVNVWGGQAESCAKNLVKGQMVAVTGRLDYREWQTPDGSKRNALEVVANSVQFLMKPLNHDSAPVAEYEDSPPIY